MYKGKSDDSGVPPMVLEPPISEGFQSMEVPIEHPRHDHDPNQGNAGPDRHAFADVWGPCRLKHALKEWTLKTATNMIWIKKNMSPNLIDLIQ